MSLRQPVSSETATPSGYTNHPVIQRSYLNPHTDLMLILGAWAGDFGIVATAEFTGHVTHFDFLHTQSL